MAKKSAKPILVTGSHRSGSTWVGRMITSSPKVAYINEPFNLNHDLRICKAHFDYWFTYICEQNELDYYEQIKNTIQFRYDLIGNLKLTKRSREWMPEVRRYLEYLKYRTANIRPLIKDPIAVFSTDWLSSKFNSDTVVLIRHPLAFTGSIKVNNWTHPFSHFLAQPLLMKDHLYPFEEEIRYFAQEDRDIVDQAALLWKLIHFMILKYRESNPKWIFIRHEDLSNDPLNGFKTLFSKLNLEFSEHVSEIVAKHSLLGDLTASKSGSYKGLQRDSASIIKNWQSRLTPSEAKRIK
ncbi:sulfotransferase, partial [Desulfosarcina sp.]|nr:sulfotransferase [Desulfosarcina sp.]